MTVAQNLQKINDQIQTIYDTLNAQNITKGTLINIREQYKKINEQLMGFVNKLNTSYKNLTAASKKINNIVNVPTVVALRGGKTQRRRRRCGKTGGHVRRQYKKTLKHFSLK